MYFQLNQVVLTVLNGTVCLLGDKLVEWNHQSLLVRAICDNLTHTLIGLISATIMIMASNQKLTWTEKVILLATSALASSFIDLDHFVVAKSIKLSRAVRIHRRPFLHNTVIPIAILVLMFVIRRRSSFFNHLNLWLNMIVCAFLSHQTRDATRRGYFLYPFGATSPVPYALYIALIMALPFMLTEWLKMTTSPPKQPALHNV